MRYVPSGTTWRQVNHEARNHCHTPSAALLLIAFGCRVQRRRLRETDWHNVHVPDTWHGLALIADAARRVGFKRDLFAAKTKSGKSLLVIWQLNRAVGKAMPWLGTEVQVIAVKRHRAPSAVRLSVQHACQLAFWTAVQLSDAIFNGGMEIPCFAVMNG